MDNLTRIVKTEISRQYKSVRQFAFAVNIPLSTINSALHNGIGGSSFDTVVQIVGYCKTEEEFSRRTLGGVIRKYFENSYLGAVSALVEEEKISVDELRELIDRIETQNRR